MTFRQALLNFIYLLHFGEEDLILSVFSTKIDVFYFNCRYVQS